MMRIKLHITILTVISFSLLIFFSAQVSAADFDFKIDKLNSENNSLKIEINSLINNNEVYDVKIFVHNSSDNKIERNEIFSLIEYSGEWKNPWNYIISSYPEKSIYNIKITDSEDKSKKGLCVRLRKTGTNSFSENCKNLSDEFEMVEVTKLNTFSKDSLHFVSEEGKLRFYSFYIYLIILILVFISMLVKHIRNI